MSSQYRHALLGTAQLLCQLGIRVFALKPRSKVPREGLFDKDRGKSWVTEATNDVSRVSQMFHGDTPWNIAVKVGEDSGLVDVEPDDAESNTILDNFVRASGTRTVAYKSARGVHYWFRWCPILGATKRTNIKAGALDCRMGSAAKSMYSACPPSVHPDTGEHYAWLPGCAPWETVIAEMPDNLRAFFLQKAAERPAVRQTIDLTEDEDGFLPGPGVRHDYMLRLSRLLYVDMRMPRSLVSDLLTTVSQRVGTWNEPNRGALEIQNMVAPLTRPPMPAEEFRLLDVSAAYEMASALTAQSVQRQEDMLPSELPTTVFPARIEAASQAGRAAQMPRNLMLVGSLTIASACLGNAVQVRASGTHDPIGLQLYTFGVGASGAGKSRVIKALLAPLSNSERFLTDATPEALVSTMGRHLRGLLLALAEGKDFVGMFERYREGVGSSLWLKCWSGDRILVQRKGTGTIIVPSPFLSVIAAIQRINLMQIQGLDLLDGLVQRMMVYPIGSTPRHSTQEAQQHYFTWLQQWARVVERLELVRTSINNSLAAFNGVGSGQGAVPCMMTLDAEAFVLWQQYADYKKSEAVSTAWPEEHPWQSDVARHAEIVLRVSAVLKWLDMASEDNVWCAYDLREATQGPVERTWVSRAIELVEWMWRWKQYYLDAKVDEAFCRLAGPVLGSGQALGDVMRDTMLTRARKLANRGSDTWTLREYYRTFRIKQSEAEAELSTFMAHGWVVMVPDTKPVSYRFAEGVL